MPRTLTVHPLSVALGVALGAVCLLSMSQVTVGTPMRVEYLAHPRDMVQIHQGTPYLVPTGKTFVLTALGDRGTCGSIITLSVNGQQELNGTPLYSSVEPVPPGFTVAAGSTITLTGGCSSDFTAGRAWGYLVSQ